MLTIALGELGGVNTLNTSVCLMDGFAAKLGAMRHDCNDWRCAVDKAEKGKMFARMTSWPVGVGTPCWPLSIEC